MTQTCNFSGASDKIYGTQCAKRFSEKLIGLVLDYLPMSKAAIAVAPPRSRLVTHSYSLEPELIQRISATAERLGVNQSHLVRQLLSQALDLLDGEASE